MKSFKTNLSFTREKEDNWDIERKAEKKGFQKTEDLVYLGYEVVMQVEIFEDGSNKVLKIDGVDVKDKNLSV